MNKVNTIGAPSAPAINPPAANAAAPARPALDANAAQASQAPVAVDVAALKEAVHGINEYLKTVNREIEFSIDEETGRTIVKLHDNTTGEVVRQIPSEAVLAAMHELDKLRGLLIHAEV